MNVVHSAAAPWAEAINRGRLQQRRKHLGGEKLACGLWELPPGKRFVFRRGAQVDYFDGEPDAG